MNVLTPPAALKWERKDLFGRGIGVVASNLCLSICIAGGEVDGVVTSGIGWSKSII